MSADRELVMTRTFDAPRERVFRAWVEPERLAAWWGPTDFTVPTCELDVRIGGAYRLCMRSPEGRDYWLAGEYLEISAPERLVMTQWFADADGNNVGPAAHGLDTDVPSVMTLTVTLAEEDGRTVQTVHQSMRLDVAERYQATVGWDQSFDKLQADVERRG